MNSQTNNLQCFIKNIEGIDKNSDISITIKNELNQYVYISPLRALQIGLDKKQWLNKALCEIDISYNYLHSQLEQIFKNLKEGRKREIRQIAFIGANTGNVIETYTNKPIILNNKFCGEICVINKLYYQNVAYNILDSYNQKLAQKQQVITYSNDYGLSSTKQMILFLLICGFSQTEIAYICNYYNQINITVNTVKYHLKYLIEKFQVRGIKELIDYAIAHNYHYNIPLQFSGNNVCNIIDC